MKKSSTVIIVVVSAIISLLAFAACKDKDKEPVYDGTDEYGRTFGEIYDIDSEETGTFRLPYEIGDTSSMGKTMISANCADYVTVEKTGSAYILTFYCNDGMLGGVRLVRESGAVAGKEDGANGYQSFSFDIGKEELSGRISLECEVKIMNKTVSFSITADVNNAKLVG